MVEITDNDYLGSAKILWEWLELQIITIWDQWRYSGNDWNYSQWLPGISGDTLGMVGITDTDYLGQQRYSGNGSNCRQLLPGISGDTLGLVGITCNDYLRSVKIIWEWLELHKMTTWDQQRYSGNGWNYMQCLPGISGDTLGMVEQWLPEISGDTVLWKWLKLHTMTTWDQRRYSGNGWNYSQWLPGISGDTLVMVGITANDYLGSVEILWEWLELQPMTTWDQWLISGQCWLRGWEQLCAPSHGSPSLLASSQIFQPWSHWLLLFSASESDPTYTRDEVNLFVTSHDKIN